MSPPEDLRRLGAVVAAERGPHLHERLVLARQLERLADRLEVDLSEAEATLREVAMASPEHGAEAMRARQRLLGSRPLLTPELQAARERMLGRESRPVFGRSPEPSVLTDEERRDADAAGWRAS